MKGVGFLFINTSNKRKHLVYVFLSYDIHLYIDERRCIVHIMGTLYLTMNLQIWKTWKFLVKSFSQAWNPFDSLRIIWIQSN